MTNTAQVFEAQFNHGMALADAHVNRETGVVQNVTLLGRESTNGYTYSDRAMQDAVRLYEGAKFFIDHPLQSELRERRGVRSVRDLAGKITNPRLVGDRVRGDVHLLNRSDVRDLVFAIAEQPLDRVGMSHRASAILRREGSGPNQRLLVESLEKVAGVELVAETATVQNLYESSDPEDDMKLSELTLDHLRAERADLIEALVAEAKTGETVTDLKAEATRLRHENDRLTAEIATRDRATLIARKLEEANLPATVCTDVFRQQLVEAKDEAAVDRLLEDRKALVAGIQGAPKSRERTFRTTPDGPKQIEESQYEAVAKRLGLPLQTITD